MISDVVLSGSAGSCINKLFRYVEIVRPTPIGGEFPTDRIPVMYWSKQPSCAFYRIPVGSLVLVKGRLETDPELGVVILCEHLEILSRNDKMNLKTFKKE